MLVKPELTEIEQSDTYFDKYSIYLPRSFQKGYHFEPDDRLSMEINWDKYVPAAILPSADQGRGIKISIYHSADGYVESNGA